MKSLARIWLVLLIGCSFPVCAEDPTSIIYWSRIADNPVIFQILGTILDKTVEEYGPYRVEPSAPMEQRRAIIELQKNRLVNIANFAPTYARESELIPIRIPVTRGLLGYRVCLIKRGDQYKFDRVNSLDDWLQQQLTIGQVVYWPDAQILKRHAIPVIESAKYQLMFRMLLKNRFDCFLRSITEVTHELKKYSRLDIELERRLLFIYPLPTFFFVSRQNPQLAVRIQTGFELAMADGSIDRILQGEYRNSLEQIHLDQRVPIYLENPYLSEETRKSLLTYRGAITDEFRRR